MGWYEKWLRFWADKPVLDLVELINNNPGIVRKVAMDFYVVGKISIYVGGDDGSVMMTGKLYCGCNNKLIRRAILTALVKQQSLPSNEETE